MLSLWESQEIKSAQSKANSHSVLVSYGQQTLAFYNKFVFLDLWGRGSSYACENGVEPPYIDSLGISTKAALCPHGSELPVARTGQHQRLRPGWKIPPAKDRHLLKHQPA